MSDQDGIDYEALAYSSGLKALAEFDFGVETVAHVNIARAVVAAYREQRAAQGFVEISKDDVGHLLDVYEYSTDDPEGPQYDAALVGRVAIALGIIDEADAELTPDAG